MRKWWIFASVLFCAAASVAAVMASRVENVLRPHSFVGPVPVGGLTPEQASHRLRVWWETERKTPLVLVANGLTAMPNPRTPTSLGVGLDDLASIAPIPVLGLVDQMTLRDLPRLDVPLIFTPNGVSLAELDAEVQRLAPLAKPAAVTFSKGVIHRTFESISVSLDTDSVYTAVLTALESQEPVQLPLKEAPKRIPDDELNRIRDVKSSFSTRFPASNVPRSSNIRLAAQKLDGLILMPGENFSFNETVGPRTTRAGYRVAGVYVNGRHDTGIGGGICQVSSTMYNAAIFANLKIVRRHSHSMPVPYVALGQDAAVSYPSLDLVIENSSDAPIAISTLYIPGRLTVRVLGEKVPGQVVSIRRSAVRSWDRGQEVVVDRSLKPGSRRVVERGSRGYSLTMQRVVKRNGVLVLKESLGPSYYGGGPRIVAVGPSRQGPTGSRENPVPGSRGGPSQISRQFRG